MGRVSFARGDDIVPTPAASVSLSAAVRRVLWITLALNVVVSASKIVVGEMSGSLSMVADGYHSLLDGLNNVIGLVVLAFAHRPPDADHTYGHRKFETAATLGIGLALSALAYRLIEGALGRIANPQLPSIGPLNFAVMLATLATNVFVAWYEARAGRRLGSEYLIADAAHTRSDIYVTMGVIGSFAGARAGVPWMDPVIAVAIGAFIGYQASRILLSSFHVLTDRAPVDPAAVREVVKGVAGVQDARGVRARGGPDAAYVDLIAHVDGSLTLTEAHAIADAIEERLMEKYPQIVDVVVHLEPA